MNPTNCPKCESDSVYQDMNLWVCPMCAHEWSPEAAAAEAAAEAEKGIIKDAHGNILADGDAVTVIKDLRIKGSSSVVKVGTKVKNIKLTPDGDDGHDISCKIEGFGPMNLKSEYVKKA